MFFAIVPRGSVNYWQLWAEAGFGSHWTPGVSCYSPSWLQGVCATCRDRLGCCRWNAWNVDLPVLCSSLQKKSVLVGTCYLSKLIKKSISNVTFILKIAFYTFRAARIYCRKKLQNAHLLKAGVVISTVWNLCLLLSSQRGITTARSPLQQLLGLAEWQDSGPAGEKGLGEVPNPSFSLWARLAPTWDRVSHGVAWVICGNLWEWQFGSQLAVSGEKMKC